MLLTEADIPWLHDLARKKYDHKYDLVTTEGWYRNVVLKQPLMFLPLRTMHAFCVTMLTVTPWLPSEFDANVVLLCAADGHMWEAMKLMRSSADWARKRKCKQWSLTSDTSTDLAAFARRIGATEISPRFIMRL